MQIVIGTATMMAWSSSDEGETWNRMTKGVHYPVTPAWALSSHPARPGELLVGTDNGIMRWRSVDEEWIPLFNEMSGTPVWALAHAPWDPDFILAGTRRPAAFYCSTDAGKTWKWLPARLAQSCAAVTYPRVTKFVFDPKNENTIWGAVEIDHIWRSSDRGETWKQTTRGLISGDIHGLAVSSVKERVFAATDQGLHMTTNEGETWSHIPLDSPDQYTRSVIVSPHTPQTIFVTNGNGPPGSWGYLFRSDDHGDTWRKVPMPTELNSTLWKFAPHPENPMVIFCSTKLGQVFRSGDGGASWTKVKREFGDIRSLEWAWI
ncbi:UNVERIFIED_ORG: photosystem II stability/assembly factor-like uncharacterized protein [Paraburkholderia sediminicola]|nr:photosystem II stability/assembly factor-like uncharacterized protein [Paraburkholderia sediminicola]